MNTQETYDVVVVGGGISGLSAAFEAKSKGLKVVLLESEPRLGGVLSSVRSDGWIMEEGAESMLASKPAARQLCRDLGIEDQLVQTQPQWRGTQIVSQGRLMNVPLDFRLMAPQNLWSFARSPLLSLKGKFRVFSELLRVRKDDPNADVSMADFVRDHFGNECLQQLAQPLGGGIFTASPELLSMEAAFPQFIEMARREGSVSRALLMSLMRSGPQRSMTQFLAPGQAVPEEGRHRFAALLRAVTGTLPRAKPIEFESMRLGMFSLVEELHRSLGDICRPGVAVTGLTQSVRGDSIWTAHTPELSYQARRVILAVPAWAAARLLGADVSSQLAGELAAIPYLSSATVNLQYQATEVRGSTQAFGFIVPYKEQVQQNLGILACTYSHRKYLGRCPEGQILLRTYLGGSYFPHIERCLDSELAALSHRNLTKLLKIQGEPLAVHVARSNATMPVYQVGHLARIARVEEGLREFSGLTLIGSYLRGVGIPDCIGLARSLRY